MKSEIVRRFINCLFVLTVVIQIIHDFQIFLIEGITINMGKRIAKDADFDAIFVAEKKFWPPVSCRVLYWSSHCWSLHQCFSAHL